MLSVVPVALIIALIFGISPIIHKYIFNIVPTVTPQTMFIFGGLFYFIFTLIFAICQKQTLIESVQNVPWAVIFLFLIGTSVSFLANFLYFKIISKNASYLVSSLIFTSPLFTLILSYLFLKENITITSVIGIILITLGVILIALSSKETNISIPRIKGD